jgi:phenylalanyl-tRNA synthetase beta chain
MTNLTLNRKEVEEKIGKINEKIEDRIVMMGTTIEEMNNDSLSVDVTPNRPDLLSLQGFTRSFLQFIGKEGVKKYKTKEAEKDFEVKIDKSVKKVRPYTVCMIVKNLKLSDEKIKELIDIQEKLHLTVGRKRKKLAIGIYPLEKIKLPIKYLAKKPEEIKFQPLEFPRELTGRQILSQHPAGREYAHLIEKSELFPIFMDANNKVLSMPPIINSQETGKISLETKEVFVECSGFNLEYLKKTLNILACCFADMNGDIYQIKIDDPDGKFHSPNLEQEKMEFKIEEINKTLGLTLTEKEIRNYLEKRGIEMIKEKEKFISLIPPYRTDILHWIDLTEEVAIAHGYENFVPEIPKIATIGEESKEAKRKRLLQNIISGLGFLEVSSFHLANKEDIKKMHFDFKGFIEVEESKTDYNVLRMDLLSNILKILYENSDSGYPQSIYEIGRVFAKNKEKETGIEEKERLAVAIANEKLNFTQIKQVLDYLFKMLGKEYKLEPVESSNFIIGRAAKILVNEKEVGILGEIAPRVLKNWKIRMPTVALEMGLDWLN